MLLLLALALACRHPILTPTLNGRPTQTLRAETRKVEDRWVVTLPLPVGTWTARALGEDQPMETCVVEGKTAPRWKVGSTRWANSDRPFVLQLVNPEGRALDLSVTYPLFSRGTQNLLISLAHGWWPIPLGK